MLFRSVVAPELLSSPVVAGVGDLHAENFGTWRDLEGRLVWGVNDFDEADAVPYAADLARLATSIVLACRSERLRVAPEAAVAALVDGYTHGVEQGAEPTVLAERRRWLSALVQPLFEDERAFWRALEDAPAESSLPPAAQTALACSSPGEEWTHTVHRRIAGVGSQIGRASCRERV